MKKRKNGRAKGSHFELVVAKKFAAWTGDVVRRTPLSGGWSREKGFDVGGDLVFTKVKTLHVECKCQEGWKLEDLLTGKNRDKIWAWWRQARSECGEGKQPLLVFTRNRMPAFVMHYVELGIEHGVDWNVENLKASRLNSFVHPRRKVAVMKLDDFMLVRTFVRSSKKRKTK